MPIGSFRQRREQHAEDRSTSLELPLLHSSAEAPFSPHDAFTTTTTTTTTRGGGRSRGAGQSLNEGGMDSHDGIQKLLAAEQEAQAIVTAARQEKTQRLRQAKEEADAEVAAYRAQREATYQKMLAEQSGDSSQASQRMSADSEGAIRGIHTAVQSNKQKVSEMLMKHVTTVGM